MGSLPSSKITEFLRTKKLPLLSHWPAKGIKIATAGLIAMLVVLPTIGTRVDAFGRVLIALCHGGRRHSVFYYQM